MTDREPTAWECETGEVDPDDPYDEKDSWAAWRSFLGPLWYDDPEDQ